MKLIGIDARLYFQTGVGVYTRNLLYFLQKIAPKDITFYVYVMKDDSPSISLSNPLFIKKEVTTKWHSFAEQASFFKTLMTDNLDLMHFTYFSYPVRYKKPFVATVHDITPLIFKTGKASTKNKVWYQIKYQAFKYVLRSQVKYAQAIITPTKTVKKQLVSVFGKKIDKKITCMYEGIDYQLKETKENKLLKKEFPFDFFLYIGNFYPHKNVDALVEAYAKTTIPQKLVLKGPASFFSERLKTRVVDLGQQDRILFYHNSSSEDLVYLYRHAKAIINPSLSEGFGLPLVEAVYFNLPILASHIEVFKELLQKNYLSFDPTSLESIQKCLEKASAQQLVCDYSKIKDQFSFEEMAQQTFDLYQHVLKENLK